MSKQENMFENEVPRSRKESFIERYSEVSVLESRFYWEGSSYSIALASTNNELTVSVDDQVFHYKYPAEELGVSSSFEVINGELNFKLVTRPKEGSEMYVSTRIIDLETMQKGDKSELEKMTGSLRVLKNLDPTQPAEFYNVIFDDKAPVEVQIGDQKIALPENLYFLKCFRDKNNSLFFTFDSGYRGHIYRYVDGEFIPTTKYFDIEEPLLRNQTYYSRVQGDEQRYGSVVAFETPEDTNELITGTSDCRVFDIINIFGPHIFVESYDQNNSFFISVWNKNGEREDPTNLNIHSSLHFLFEPTKPNNYLSNYRVLGSNDNNLTIMITVKGQPVVYNLTNDNGIITSSIEKPINNTQLWSESKLTLLERDGMKVPIVLDKSGANNSIPNLYPERTGVVKTYGAKLSPHSLRNGYPFGEYQLAADSRGLPIASILSEGCETDFKKSIRVRPDKEAQKQEFGPAQECVLVLLQNIRSQSPRPIILEGTSFAGVSIVLTVSRLLEMHIANEISTEELEKIFDFTVFSTITATMDTNTARVHNQPYYFSPKYVQENYPDRQDLLELAQYRSPLSNLTQILAKLDQNNKGILQKLKFSIITYAEDKRCPIQAHNEFVDLLRINNIQCLYKVLPLSNHGLRLTPDTIDEIIEYWKEQGNLFDI